MNMVVAPLSGNEILIFGGLESGRKGDGFIFNVDTDELSALPIRDPGNPANKYDTIGNQCATNMAG